MPHVLMSLRPDGRAISFFGDLHPSFSGNVVKAMGSAKQGYPVVSRMLARRQPAEPAPAALMATLNDELRAVVHDVIRLTPNIVEVVVRAPIAARAFLPGQFYRLQNYETLAPRTRRHRARHGGTGADRRFRRSRARDALDHRAGDGRVFGSLRAVEAGRAGHSDGSDRHADAKRRRKKLCCWSGGGLGNAVLFSIGQKLRAAGSRVIYSPDIRRSSTATRWRRSRRRRMWWSGAATKRPALRPAACRTARLSATSWRPWRLTDAAIWAMPEIPLSAVDRLIVIGSDGMMRAVQQARHAVLQPYLKPDHHAIGSINSPMQCMMKEICAQCLQVHKDPETGEETVVFSCFNQDQPLDHVDFGSLRTRLTQNGAQEKLTKMWIDHCLREIGARSEPVAQA